MPNVDRTPRAPGKPIISVSAVLVALCVIAPSAYGQGRTADLKADRGWPAGTIQEQLDQDATMVPFGKGAIFVPAMTNPLDEPPVSVWQGETQIAEGTTGRRIVVMPGDYTVEMGTGAGKQRFKVHTSVRELNVSVIPVTWAGLAVHVVDERLNSIRNSYEIIRVDSRDYVDVGFGADEQAGEPVTTWILQPGLYKIVRVGETYRARRDFATVRLIGGRLTDFLLVVDEETGDFKGAGEAPREELFLARRGNLWWSFIFGGDVNMSSRQKALTVSDGERLSFRAFLDTKLSVKIFESPLILQLQVEGGGAIASGVFSQDPALDVPWLKTHDRIDLDGLYVYQLFPWLGPYLRFNVETNLLEDLEYFEEESGSKARRVVVLDPDGNYKRIRKERENVRLLPSFGLTSIKEGIGINLRVFKELWGKTSLRLGFGARHKITRQLIQSVEESVPIAVNAECAVANCVVYQQLPISQQIGVEATVLSTLRLTRWVLINIELDSLIPFDDIRNVVIDIDTTLQLKLTRFVSINYIFRYLRDPALSAPDEKPLDRFVQELVVRFSVELP